MCGRRTLTACVATLLACSLSFTAAQETFVRPNESEECSDSVDFLAYAATLPNVECTAEECEYLEQAASLFDIRYRESYKVIDYKSSSELTGEIIDGEPVLTTVVTYILHQCGSAEPDDDFILDLLDNNATLHFIELPVTAAATEDSTVGWMLEELGVLDRVRYGGAFSTSPCMQLLVDPQADGGCDRPFIGAFDETATPTPISDIDVNIGFFSDIDNKGVISQASADPSPLARAEHIVYLSTFFNVEADGIAFYTEVETTYLANAGDVTAADTAPTVAWVSYNADVSFFGYVNAEGTVIEEGSAVVVSFARYKTLVTADAGGALVSQSGVLEAEGAFASNDDIIFASAEFATPAAMLAAVQGVLEGVDILIDESFRSDPDTAVVGDLLTELGLDAADITPADFPFLANDNIWRHDKALTIDGNDDWFGEAVARPDIVHQDLVEIITPGSIPNHVFVFFRNFSEGEEVTVSGPEDCTPAVLTCTSWLNQEALLGAVDLDATAPVEVADSPEGTVADDDDSGVGCSLISGAALAACAFAAVFVA